LQPWPYIKIKISSFATSKAIGYRVATKKFQKTGDFTMCCHAGRSENEGIHPELKSQVHLSLKDIF